jgi:hypothetical protein
VRLLRPSSSHTLPQVCRSRRSAAHRSSEQEGRRREGRQHGRSRCGVPEGRERDEGTRSASTIKAVSTELQSNLNIDDFFRNGNNM